MTPTCEVLVDLCREPRIEGNLVTPVNCSYPDCTEDMLFGIVVAFMDKGGVMRAASTAREYIVDTRDNVGRAVPV